MAGKAAGREDLAFELRVGSKRSVHREESQGREPLENASRVDRERTLKEQEGVHEREGRIEGDNASVAPREVREPCAGWSGHRVELDREVALVHGQAAEVCS